MRKAIAAFIGLGLLAGGAAADGYDTVRAALDAGDYDKAYATLAEMGDAGDTLAMTMLADLQLGGVTGSPNYAIALAWLGEAAARGSIHAMLRLGAIYQLSGTAVLPDWQGLPIAAGYPEAVRWYGAAAAAGSPVALSRLGLLHNFGIYSLIEGTISRDEEIALTWEYLEQAVAAGRADAMGVLGLALRRDNPDRSAELIRRAAELGDPASLGIMATQSGDGGVFEPVEALAWAYAARTVWEMDPNPRSRLIIASGAATGEEFIAAMDGIIAAAAPEDRAAAEARAAEITAGWVSLLPGQFVP